jgi:hypothetical protein
MVFLQRFNIYYHKIDADLMITQEDIFLINEERQARYGWVEDFQQNIVGKKLVYPLGRKLIR